jgi:hypothetical protein
MATNDRFEPDDPLPLFLSADEPEQRISIDRAVITIRGFKASILAATVIAFGIAAWVGNPVTLFADVTALLVDRSTPQLVTDQLTPIIQTVAIQPTADAEALPPTAKDAPTREISASEPASQTNQTENSEPSLEAFFKEFRAWAAEQDARALAKSAQDAPTRVVEDAPAPPRSMQKHRRAARSIRNARAEVRHVRRQNERVQARPMQDGAQNQSVQNAETLSFLQSFNPFATSPPQRGP